MVIALQPIQYCTPSSQEPGQCFSGQPAVLTREEEKEKEIFQLSTTGRSPFGRSDQKIDCIINIFLMTIPVLISFLDFWKDGRSFPPEKAYPETMQDRVEGYVDRVHIRFLR